MSTWKQLLEWGREILMKHEIPEASNNAWLLLEEAGGPSRARYFLEQEESAPSEVEEKYLQWIEKRVDRIPIQHLTNRAYFMGMEFYVDENVLIPRQDTEVLVEEVLKKIKPGMKILDMCTGSGCILLSILALGEGLDGTGADISKEALKVAEENRKRLRLKAQLINSDLFEKIEGVFDVIVSNPPYIPTGEISGLMDEVRDHDPVLALDGREDGLHFYREISKESRKYLKKGGWIFYEIGHDQAEEVSNILKKEGYTQIKVKKDLAGLDRVVYASV